MSDHDTSTAQSVPITPVEPQAATSDAETPDLGSRDYWARPGEWTPRFGSQRPPWAHGNVASLRDGSRSPRVYGPRAQELAAGLLADRPDLATPSYAAAVGVWATYAARFELRSAAPDSDDYTLLRLGNALLKAGAVLGLDPRNDAALAKDRAAASMLASSVDLDALVARGRAALAANPAAQNATTSTTEVATATRVDDDDRPEDRT